MSETKTKVKPVSKAEASKLQAQADGMLSGYKSQLDDGPSVGSEKRGTAMSRVKARAAKISETPDVLVMAEPRVEKFGPQRLELVIAEFLESLF